MSIREKIEKMKEFDSEEYDGKDYSYIMKYSEQLINEISNYGEEALKDIYPLLDKEDSWVPLISLEILKRIKSEKSVHTLINFIQKYQFSDNFSVCDDAIQILMSIGSPAVEELISALKSEFENKIYGGYLDETLSHIEDGRASEFRLSVLVDYVNNPNKYNKWFNLTLFIAGFREWNTEALPYLKKLREMNLNREEKKELKSAIECIESPEEYKKYLDKDIEMMKPLFEALFKPKISRNDPCPCGSGKKYKKCCLDKVGK